MSADASSTRGPWSRFAEAFRARRSSRWAWRALLLCVGLAVFAPLLANERPWFARLRDVRGYEAARLMLVPIARQLTEDPDTRASSADEGALRDALSAIESKLGATGNERRFTAVAELRAALDRRVARDPFSSAEDAAALLARVAASASTALELGRDELQALRPQTWHPLAASLSGLDIAALLAWIAVASFARWPRLLAVGGVRRRLARVIVWSLALGFAAQLLPAPSTRIESSSWKSRLAADPESVAVFAPIAFGPAETDLSRALEAPLAHGEGRRHLCGTDALGRDLLARLLYAGRTSFAVACVAAALITLVGAALGLAAGTLRGAADVLVSRAIELLQAFPTLVLLLGIVALLPARAADSKWSVPLSIGLVGWAHVARLARAEALRVGATGYVQAALASGLPRARVIWRHVLPNALGPVWIAASFALSAGLVLESAAAFLGFGVQLPAPSFGALLADARATQAWWLALFPGLWLFAAILSIHRVGEGVRDALDPRDGGGER